MIVWDEKKRRINLEKHGFDFEDAHLVYDDPSKMTIFHSALEKIGGWIQHSLSAVSIFGPSRFDARHEKNGGYMQNSGRKSMTDWERVRREIAEDAPIPYDPEDGPYDPNDDAAVDAYWAQATIIRPNHRGPQKAPIKKQVSLRLSPEVVEHFKGSGRGWQTRIDETLKKAIAPKRRKKAS